MTEHNTGLHSPDLPTPAAEELPRGEEVVLPFFIRIPQEYLQRRWHQLRHDLKAKPLHRHMRTLHRDIGFFVIGLTLIYCLSGIMLIFRGSDFLYNEELTVQMIEPGLPKQQLARAAHSHGLKFTGKEGNILYFEGGSYDSKTGQLVYTDQDFYFPFNVFSKLHLEAYTRNAVAIFGAFYAILLGFLAVSSFWMFKPGTIQFRRGVKLSVAGFLFAFLLLLFV